MMNRNIQFTNFVLCTYIIVVAQIGSKLKVQAVPGLVAPSERTTGLGCIPEGRNVSYECTLRGVETESTNWRGSLIAAFCFNPDNLVLTHFEFSTQFRKCGDLKGINVNKTGELYTSKITFRATTSLDGKNINCTLGGALLIGYDRVRVGAPPPPLSLLSIKFHPSSTLTVNWNIPSETSNLRGYLFLVTGEDCGCESMNVSVSTTSVSCSDWMAKGQTCSFEVRTISQDCGFTSDPVNQTLTLSTPKFATNLVVCPVYNKDGSAQHIHVQFTAMDEPTIGADISVTVIYIVMIGSLPFAGVQCSNQKCNLTVPGSQLKPDGLLNVSVVASNAVGSQGPAYFPTPVATNIVTQDVASVTIDVLQSTVTCNLLTSYQQTPNATCSITYGPSPNNCSLMYNSTSAFRNSSLILHLIELDVDEYCYTVKLDHGSTVLSITGTFRSQCDPQLLGTGPSPQEGVGFVAVPNGTINYNGLAPGSVATLVCNEGYSVANEINRTCMGDGHWSDETLQCINDPTPVRCGEACGIATGVSVFGVMLILIVFCVIMALYLFFKYRKDVCAVNAKVVDSEVSIINQNNIQAESTLTAQNDSAPCDKPEVTLKPQVEMYADLINLVPPSDGKESSQRQVEMYADPDDVIPTPQLPSRNYDKGEHHVNVPVQETGQSKLVEEATKPNSSQLPQELYSEVFNALPKGMAPKVVRNGTKN